ncbi:MAG: hypothetical protein ACTSPB_23230 [Candidatus Thorarchaeota archaeon]
MDDEIKGIPRRYTEDEWRELTKKKTKGIRPIFKQLALLVSVMIGVALAVSAYTGSSNTIVVSGTVGGDPNFVVEFREEGSSTWTQTLSLDYGVVERGTNVDKKIYIRWHDSDPSTSVATVTSFDATNLVNVENIRLYGGSSSDPFVGHVLSESNEYFFHLVAYIPLTVNIGDSVSFDLTINFQTG